jgi:hypothetical protein
MTTARDNLLLIADMCDEDRAKMVVRDGYETAIAARHRLGAQAMRELHQLKYDLHHAEHYPNLSSSNQTPPSVPTPERIIEEVEAARNHLYTALGSVTLLTGYLPDFAEISGHIKQALSMLPRLSFTEKSDEVNDTDH